MPGGSVRPWQRPPPAPEAVRCSMSWRESLSPVRMERVAVVAPEQHRRELLATLARCAAVELDLPHVPGNGPEELDRTAAAAVVSGPFAGWVGWMPARQSS